MDLSITTNPPANPAVCAGNSREVPFTTQGTVPTGTRFVAQLSDASGSFATPTVLGEATPGNTTLSRVPATIPANAPPGNYQVRIVTTNTSPIVIGSSTPLTISAAPALSIVIGYPNNNTVVADGDLVTLTPQLTPSSPVASYNWLKPDGTTATTATLTVPFAATAATARYSPTLTTGSGCVLTGSSSLTPTEPTCDIRIVSKDGTGAETDRIPRVGGLLGSLTLSVESLDGMALTGYTYVWERRTGAPATGVSSSTGANTHSVTVVAVGTTPIISATAIGEYSVVITDGAGNTCVAYTTLSAKPCTERTAAYTGCKDVTVQNPDATNAIANLAPGDEFYAGDYKVTVTSITGGGPGGWTGEGIVDVTLLKGVNLPAQVTFSNAKLNECYELTAGKLITKYDPSWFSTLNSSSTNTGSYLFDLEELTNEVADLYSTSLASLTTDDEKALLQIEEIKDKITSDPTLPETIKQELLTRINGFLTCSASASANTNQALKNSLARIAALEPCNLANSAQQIKEYLNSQETLTTIMSSKVPFDDPPTSVKIIKKVGTGTPQLSKIYAVNAEGELVYLGREAAKNTPKAVLLGNVISKAASVIVLVFTPTSLGTEDVGPLANPRAYVDQTYIAPDLNASKEQTDTEVEPKKAPNTEPDIDEDDGKRYLVYIAKRNHKKCLEKKVDLCLKYVGISTASEEEFIGFRYRAGEIQVTDFVIFFTNLKKGEARGVEQQIIELNNGGQPYTERFPQGMNKIIDNIKNSTSPTRTTLRDPAYTTRNLAGIRVLNQKYPNFRWQQAYVPNAFPAFSQGGFRFTGLEYQGDPNCDCNNKSR